MEKTVPQFLWNGIDLEALRLVMDQPCDDAVASVFESKSMRHLATILKEMAANDDFVSDELPPAMHDFVTQELQIVFSDEDIRMFKQTHTIWQEHGMKFVFILFFRALPYTYMAEKPANVLRMTKLLETQTERRVIETAQFVFDVMEKNWWKPDKRGILTALKVRIMHSAMRHIILDSGMQGETWIDDWGKPISQEDLIATNQVFSLEFFKGMAMMGQPLTAEEQKAWFHTWKTIAKIMGVQENLICDTVEEAWDLQHAIYAHLFNDKTHSGIALAKALVETMHQFHMPEKLALFLMKTMLADDQFPDCFERMLGPSYAEAHPELFVKHDSLAAEEKHKKEVLQKQLHAHAMDYYQTIKEKKSSLKKTDAQIGFLLFILNWLLSLFGVDNNKLHRIDIELELLHNILHDAETGEPLEEIEEESIVELITIFGGIIVSILSVHFREGKESGFRIPKDLQENWALKG
ncbi:oxygenase MpaB family protein [Rhodohalobacter sp. 614A]|uniref:oxygenase MpaB family protein n=1 Tax=Rhodohalobacter sp. 614A TaxID=2908649 RepID=UPI001F3BD339|nr:oxygenase MpaB family protein [Rhodohalobacter sp. 614A]